MQVGQSVGEELLGAYRALISDEARLSEALAPRGIRVGTSLIDQWTALHEYLHLYASGISPAGLLVLGGRPDDGSRRTGIPFTGAREAREILGLSVAGASSSPSGAAFWKAVDQARRARDDAPLEALFGTMHLAHALPFDYDAAPEVEEAACAHVLRLLGHTRPQAVAAVGAPALMTLARALAHPDLMDLARAPEEAWTARWPAGSRLLDYPRAEVPVAQPFRVRVVPVPQLDGAAGASGERALVRLFEYVLS